MSKDCTKSYFDVKLCFVGDVVDETWVNAIREVVGPWVKSCGNKSLWELVSFVSQRRGVLKPKLARWKFCSLLLKNCREAVSNDSESSLEASMDKYEFKNELKRFDDLLSGHVVRAKVEELEDMFKGYEVVKKQEAPKVPSVAELTERYLREDVVENTTQKVVTQICYNNRLYPTVALEQYFTQEKEGNPSFVVAFECVEGEPDWNALYGRMIDYNQYRRRIRLFFVTSVPYPDDFSRKAKSMDVGLWCFNLTHPHKKPTIVLNRSTKYREGLQREWDRMTGDIPMESTMLMCMNNFFTTSLADMLERLGIMVRKENQIKAPTYTDVEIEQKATEFADSCYTFPIDPFEIANQLDIHYSWECLPQSQAGISNFQEKKIILNRSDINQNERTRFTIAHELGHFIFHRELFKKYGLVSMDDTPDTLGQVDQTAIPNKELFWLEHHANCFASCFLMPTQQVLESFIDHYTQHITNKYGDTRYHLYWADDNKTAKYNCLGVIKPMARYFFVSGEAMRWRLYHLGVLSIEGLPDRPNRLNELFS